eukprot:7054281-Prymnesium_polylepis.1
MARAGWSGGAAVLSRRFRHMDVRFSAVWCSFDLTVRRETDTSSFYNVQKVSGRMYHPPRTPLRKQ